MSKSDALCFRRRPASLSAGYCDVTAFTLAEVLVAVAIFAAAATAIFTAMRTSAAARHQGRMLTGSVLLAETLLAEVFVDQHRTFETRRGRQGPYTWQVHVAPTPVENLAAVKVTVAWPQQQKMRRYELFSLVHQPPSIEGK